MPKGIYPRTIEHNRNIGLALKDRPLSPEHKKRVLLANSLKKGTNHFKFESNILNNFSPSNMWLLGIFASDGSMIKEKSRGYRINFTGEIEEMEKVKELSNHGRIFVLKKLRNHANFYFRDIRVFKELQKLGMVQNKSLILEYPKIPFEYNIERHFIRGYFDGDGCVSLLSKKYLNFHSSFCSGSLNFILKLKERLESYGIYCSNIKKSKNNLGSAYIITLGVESSLKLYKFMYEDVNNNILYSRKKLKFQELIAGWHLKNNLSNPKGDAIFTNERCRRIYIQLQNNSLLVVK